jgi:LPXTG-motif cell wall-anchored protein
MQRWIRLAAGLGLVVLGVALNVAPASAANTDVMIMNLAFSPQTITVGVGDTVTWTNHDAVDHTVSADNFAFGGFLSAGATFVYTADTVGAFPYHCNIHPQMTGTVNVVQQVTTTTGATTTTSQATTTTGGGTTTSVSPSSTAAPSSTASVLPVTGSHNGPLAVAGFLCVGAGAVLMATSRRRAAAER